MWERASSERSSRGRSLPPILRRTAPMIVKCEKCQARFRMNDEKVSDAGVRVRCSKCQHTFKVRRDGGEGGAEQAPDPAPLPAARPGPLRASSRAAPPPAASLASPE